MKLGAPHESQRGSGPRLSSHVPEPWNIREAQFQSSTRPCRRNAVALDAYCVALRPAASQYSPGPNRQDACSRCEFVSGTPRVPSGVSDPRSSLPTEKLLGVVIYLPPDMTKVYSVKTNGQSPSLS